MAKKTDSTDSKQTAKKKASTRAKVDPKTGKKKTTKRKRAKVEMPKMTNMYRPADMSIVNWQIALRAQQAKKESFAITRLDDVESPGLFRVVNPTTRSEYKVVYRGKESLWNYCSCLDFKTSQLGTCKHLEAVKLWAKGKHNINHPEELAYSSVYIDYKGPRKVKIRLGEDNREILQRLAKDYFDAEGVMRQEAYAKFDVFLGAANAIDANFRCYDDALDYIIEKREKTLRNHLVTNKYDDGTLNKMLTVSLYPYQREGIRFAIKAGKAIIADEMGLGKTIQAIASAEIYLREGMAESVLIVCPTSLKYQWKKEIEKFTGGDRIEAADDYLEDGRICPKVIVIEGNPQKRAELYRARAPYKIVSYHAMTNDVRHQGKLTTDVLIMDEIQRLKNWDTHIARAARKVESRYAVLLSGTPLENKLEELYANMELVDQFCMGPYWKFRDEHILLDPDKGAVMGYKNLNAIGEMIRERLIRRTKKGVQLQLPKRSDQYLIVPVTEEQSAYHEEFKQAVSRIVQKYQKFHFMSEQDRKRLMLLLGQMRMVADSTFILEQNLKTRHDVKIAEVMNLLENVFENGDEKVVIFSEWERMTRLVAMELDKRGIRYEYLCGSVPSKQRGQLVENFTTLPESRVFISTDAGSTGLNLQVASILINLDLPWNPAILEQRIARIFRLGQESPVQILNLVSKSTIEEGMISKLKFKTSMFEGVLDGGDDTVFVNEDKFKKFMDDLTIVMSETPEAPMVEYVDEETEETEKPEEDDTTADEIVVDEPSIDNEVIEDEGSPVCSSQLSGAQTTEPQQLIHQGLTFLSGLAETLKSPEATQQLVDNIVEVDPDTGETNIKIPVASKDTVMQIFSLFGKLMQGGK